MNVVIIESAGAIHAASSDNWRLLLRKGEWLADDGLAEIRELIVQAGDASFIALPIYSYIGEQLLQGASYYPSHELRLARNAEGAAALGSPCPAASPGVYVPAGKAPHIHRRLGENLADFAKRRLEHALAAEPGDPAAAGSVYELLAGAADDWSTAAATIEAWARAVESALAWERKPGTSSLRQTMSMPVGTMERTVGDCGMALQAQKRAGELAEEIVRLRKQIAKQKPASGRK